MRALLAGLGNATPAAMTGRTFPGKSGANNQRKKAAKDSFGPQSLSEKSEEFRGKGFWPQPGRRGRRILAAGFDGRANDGCGQKTCRRAPPIFQTGSQGIVLVFNPKSEIQTGKMTQEVGAETNRKNRGIPKVVCRDFFNSFMPKRLCQIVGFNFGFRV